MRSNVLRRALTYIRPEKRKAKDLGIRQTFAVKEEVDSKVNERFSSYVAQFTRASTTFLENRQKDNEGFLTEILATELLVADDQSRTGRRRRREKRKHRRGNQARTLTKSGQWRFKRPLTSRNLSRRQDFEAPNLKRKRKMGKRSMKKITEEMATTLTI